MQRRAAIIFLTLAMAADCAAAEGISPREVSPGRVFLNGRRDRVQLVVSAGEGDHTRDVTREIQWHAPTGTCASVDHRGVGQASGDGEGEIVGMRGAARVVVPVTVTGTSQPVPVSFQLD